MVEDEVLIVEGDTVDGVAASAVAVGVVTSLCHEARDNSVENGAVIVEIESSRGQAGSSLGERGEVIDGLWRGRAKESEDNASLWHAIDLNVEVCLLGYWSEGVVDLLWHGCWLWCWLWCWLRCHSNWDRCWLLDWRSRHWFPHGWWCHRNWSGLWLLDGRWGDSDCSWLWDLISRRGVLNWLLKLSEGWRFEFEWFECLSVVLLGDSPRWGSCLDWGLNRYYWCNNWS